MRAPSDPVDRLAYDCENSMSSPTWNTSAALVVEPPNTTDLWLNVDAGPPKVVKVSGDRIMSGFVCADVDPEPIFLAGKSSREHDVFGVLRVRNHAGVHGNSLGVREPMARAGPLCQPGAVARPGKTLNPAGGPQQILQRAAPVEDAFHRWR